MQRNQKHYLILKLTIMEKKTIYVVTVTYLDLKDFTTSTFVEGYSEDLSGAHAARPLHSP